MKKTGFQISQALKSRGAPQTIDFSQFHEVMGEEMPGITPDAIGKYRLQQVLRRRFGATYKNHPVAQAALKHFQMSARFKG